jgi:hypothetical protein
MDSNSSVRVNKDLFNSLNQKSNMKDLNELMLKYLLDLNPKQAAVVVNKSSTNLKKEPSNQHDKLPNIPQDPNNNLVDSNADQKRPAAIRGGLANADIDFFCSRQAADSWAKFEDHFVKPSYKTNENFFEVWHKFFITLKPTYEHIYDIFKTQHLSNSQVFCHEKVQDFILCKWGSVF